MRRFVAQLLALILLLQSGLAGAGAACLGAVDGSPRLAGATPTTPAAAHEGHAHHGGHAGPDAATPADAAAESAGDQRSGGSHEGSLHCLATACATPALTVGVAPLASAQPAAERGVTALPAAPQSPRASPEPPPPRA